MSDAFTDVAKNRDGLSPAPARAPGPDCIHRDVAGDAPAGAFSSQRGHPVFPVTVPSVGVSMSIGELAPGEATRRHRHAYETIVYVLEGTGHSIVEGERFEWRAGDAIYTPPWCWHQHVAANARVRYVAATNMPALHALGQTALREEAPES